jgi:hypothetical protein
MGDGLISQLVNVAARQKLVEAETDGENVETVEDTGGLLGKGHTFQISVTIEVTPLQESPRDKVKM